MRNKKIFGVLFCGGILLFNSFGVIANSNKEVNQVEVTIDNAEEEIENIIDTEETELFYEKKASRELGEEVYSNKDDDLYLFDETGELTEYISSTETIDSTLPKLDKSVVEKTAETFLATLVEDISYYQRETLEYDEYANTYNVTYVHKIGELCTSDIVYFEIDNECNLITFCTPRLNAFASLDNLEIDTTEAQQKAIDCMKQTYGDNLVSAEIENIILGMDDNNIIRFQIDVKIDIIENGEETEYVEMVLIPY